MCGVSRRWPDSCDERDHHWKGVATGGSTGVTDFWNLDTHLTSSTASGIDSTSTNSSGTVSPHGTGSAIWVWSVEEDAEPDQVIKLSCREASVWDHIAVGVTGQKCVCVHLRKCQPPDVKCVLALAQMPTTRRDLSFKIVDDCKDG